MTKGQCKIFSEIYGKKHSRVQIISFTQYGKSETVAQAVLTRASTFPEKWAIVSTSQHKAKIIMGYIIDHIFDNEYTRNKFILEKGENEEKIRHEKSKNHVTFKISGNRIGEILTISAEARNNVNPLDALMGFGAQNVIVDESSLIDDPQYAGILRMVKGQSDNFILEIGNSLRRNHFYRTTLDTNYEHILIDYKQGLEERRISQRDVDEARKAAFFSILYECKFPPEDAVDSQGWSILLSEGEYQGAIKEAVGFGERRLGIDVAHGGRNKTVWVLKEEDKATLLEQSDIKDLMSIVGKTQLYMDEYNIPGEQVFIDGTGVGAGVVDRLREKRINVNSVILGEKASNTNLFYNKRAENYWRLREWIKYGGAFQNDDFRELLSIKYKVNSDKRIQIISKDTLREAGIESPDVADALMLCFNRSVLYTPFNKMSLDDKKFYEHRKKQNMNLNNIETILKL